MASLTWWTWVWVSSGSWWWTGKPGVLQSVGLQRVRHDWVTELNWTELKMSVSSKKGVGGLCWIKGDSKDTTIKWSMWTLVEIWLETKLWHFLGWWKKLNIYLIFDNIVELLVLLCVVMVWQLNKLMFYSKRVMLKYLEVTFHDVYKCAWVIMMIGQRESKVSICSFH